MLDLPGLAKSDFRARYVAPAVVPHKNPISHTVRNFGVRCLPDPFLDGSATKRIVDFRNHFPPFLFDLVETLTERLKKDRAPWWINAQSVGGVSLSVSLSVFLGPAPQITVRNLNDLVAQRFPIVRTKKPGRNVVDGPVEKPFELVLGEAFEFD